MKTREERIAELQAAAVKEYDGAQAAYARYYEIEAVIAGLRNQPLEVEFSAALAACYRQEEGAHERKDRAYLRLQASRCLDGNFGGISPEHLDEVRAEVERLRTEEQKGTP